MRKSECIFGNPQSERVVKHARRGAEKLRHKFGDDSRAVYHLALAENAVLGDLGAKLLVSSETPLGTLPARPVVIGNIRMGFGHYRISMAMCSAARALGYTPLWFDLNSFSETTGGKVIAYQNHLYSLGSRLSQQLPLFNRLYWEPLNSEGFRRLSYNAADQENAALMTPIYRDLPRDTPFVATHVWPAQAAVHAGFTHVVNAIPDNWQMALHLAEGSLHTVQTHSAFLGYKTLRGMEGNAVLKPMPDDSLRWVGHYIDDELVRNLDADCEARILRAQSGAPLRFLLTIGGAGAQLELFEAVIRALLPRVERGEAVLFMNAGDHRAVLEHLQQTFPALRNAPLHSEYTEIRTFARQALSGAVEGAHLFYSEDLYTAVYATNLLLRASDVLTTKPSELAFYPVPKLLLHRVGGHEAWGAIHAAELGDGTFECETLPETLQLLTLLCEERDILTQMCRAIQAQNAIGTYNGAYEAVRLAAGESSARP